MIRKILVATDGSRMAGKAVAYAADLAKQTGAKVALLGVVDRAMLMAPTLSPAATPLKVRMATEDVLRQGIEAYLASAAAASKRRGVAARTIVRTGNPAEEIVREARRAKADLIVMGSQGRSALKAAVLGSVAYGVIHRDTNIPVLVVRK
jgi:nucleotide-binding universal stress UspA family protein